LRNPFRSEGDAFRLVVLILVSGALIVASAVLVSRTVALVVAGLLLGVGLVRTGIWIRRSIASPDDENNH
jgi:hypothetical protein